MIAVSLDRVGLPPVAAVAAATAPGGFTMPAPELPGGSAPPATPATAKVAATIDVSHLMVPVDLLPLVRAVAVPVAAGAVTADGMPAPEAAAGEGEGEASLAGAARSATPAPPHAVAPVVAQAVVDAAPPPTRRHAGTVTTSTVIRRQKPSDPPIPAVATLNQSLLPPLAPKAAAVPDQEGSDTTDPTDAVATAPKKVAGADEREVMSAIDFPPSLGEERAPAATALLTAIAGAPETVAAVAPIAFRGEHARDIEPLAPVATVVAPVVAMARPVVPSTLPGPREIGVRAVSLDTAAIAPASPVPVPAAGQSPLSAPTDRASTATAAIPAIVPGATVATTGPTAAAIPVTGRAADTVAAPPHLALPALRRDEPIGQSSLAPRERNDPPTNGIVAASPPSPPPSYAGDTHRSAPLSPVPTPPRPADFAIETPSLGAVGAEVTRRDHPAGDVLHVHFAVDRSGTAALIAGASDGLERAVVATGNRLDAVTIEVRGGTASAAGSGSDGASGAGHRGGDAPPHRPATPPQPETPSMRVRSPVNKPVVRDRFA